MLNAQTDSNCIVPLTCKEFDFYASGLVRANGLVVDTTVMGGQIRSQAVIMSQLDHKAIEDSLASASKDKITAVYKEALDKSIATGQKAQKRSKRRGILALVFAATTLLSTIIALL